MSCSDDSKIQDSMLDEESDASAVSSMRSILKLIDLLPAQDPPPELVDTTVRSVLCEAEAKG